MATTLSLSELLGKPVVHPKAAHASLSHSADQGKAIVVEQTVEQFDSILSKLMNISDKGEHLMQMPTQKMSEKQRFKTHDSFQEKTLPKKSSTTKNDEDVCESQKKTLPHKENESVRKTSLEVHKDEKKNSSNVINMSSKNVQEQDNFDHQNIASFSMEEDSSKIGTTLKQEEITILLGSSVVMPFVQEKPVDFNQDNPTSSENPFETQSGEISKHVPNPPLQQMASSLISDENRAHPTHASVVSFMDVGRVEKDAPAPMDNIFGAYGATVIARSSSQQGITPFPVFQMPMMMEEGDVEGVESSGLPHDVHPSTLEGAEKKISSMTHTFFDNESMNEGFVSVSEEISHPPSLSGGGSNAVPMSAQDNDGAPVESLQDAGKIGAFRSIELTHPSSDLGIKASQSEDFTQNFQKIYTQIAQSLKDARDLRNPTFHVHLQPEGLGDVYVQLSFDKQRVEATFNLSPSGFEFLRHQKEAIASIFESQGFHSGENGLQFSMHQDSRQFTQQHSSQSQSFAPGHYSTQDRSETNTSSLISGGRTATSLNPYGTFLIDA